MARTAVREEIRAELEAFCLSPEKMERHISIIEEIRSQLPKAVRKIAQAIPEPEPKVVYVERIVEVPAKLPALSPEIHTNLDALRHSFATIRANTSNEKILDATLSAEVITMALWSGPADTYDRWAPYGLTPIQSRIADVLYRRRGGTVAYDTLAMCWTGAGKADPGPDNIKVQAFHIRNKLKASPYRVETVRGIGLTMKREVPNAAHKALAALAS